MRTYAIGDIHGHLDQLREAHRLIAEDRARSRDDAAEVVHIGDLVDRGPDSRGVIEFLSHGTAADPRWVVLCGNHDRMFHRFLTAPDRPETRLRAGLTWLHERLGGAGTLASYGVDPADPDIDRLRQEALAAVPATHVDFLSTLRLWHMAGEALFVHAGIRPGVPMAEQDEDDLVWIRDDFLLDSRDHGFLVVHGHTAVQSVEHWGNRLNIDTGAAYGRELSTVVIEGRRAWRLVPGGREAVTSPTDG